MKQAFAVILLICSSLSLVSAQEPRESLGDAARRIRAEKARQTQSTPYSDATYNDDGTINAARMYEKGMNALSSGQRDRAVSLIRSAAALGHAPAQVTMGYFAETGEGAEPARAVEWYRRAAEQGDPLAQWLLGRMYFSGHGVAQDMTQARKWLFPVAEAGNPFAQYLMALALGEQDRDIAAEWFRRAAEQGLPQGRKKYGAILHYGRGVQINRFQAYVWLLAGTLEGDTSTAEELESLADALGSSLTEKAQVEARSKPSRAAVANGCTGWQGEFDEIPAPPPPELQKYCR